LKQVMCSTIDMKLEHATGAIWQHFYSLQVCHIHAINTLWTMYPRSIRKYDSQVRFYSAFSSTEGQVWASSPYLGGLAGPFGFGYTISWLLDIHPAYQKEQHKTCELA
jgi:hypothetical protein